MKSFTQFIAENNDEFYIFRDKNNDSRYIKGCDFAERELATTTDKKLALRIPANQAELWFKTFNAQMAARNTFNKIGPFKKGEL